MFYIDEMNHLFYCQLDKTPQRVADALKSKREDEIFMEGDPVREIWEAERLEAERIRQEQEAERARQEQEANAQPDPNAANQN